MEYRFRAELWEYSGQGSWHFVTLPKDTSQEIKMIFGPHVGGFGSVRVTATIGQTTWQTSLFPDSKSGCYFLPVKKAVRTANNIADGDKVNMKLKLHGVV